MKTMRSRFCLVLGLILSEVSSYAQINSWTNSVSSKWEIPGNWSLGVAPTNTQSAAFITNATTKTVTIDATTTNAANFTTLTISNLVLSAPANTTNTLQLINAGSTVPLRIFNGFTLGSNAVLRITNSTMRVEGRAGGTVAVDGSLTNLAGGQIFTTNSTFSVGTTAGSRGDLTTIGGLLQISNNVIVGSAAGAQGTLTLAGGTNSLSGILSIGFLANSTGAVWVTDGQLVVTNLGGPIVGNGGVGQMTVSNGTVLVRSIRVALDGTSRGTLTIAGGTTVASNLTVGAAVGSLGAAWVTGGQLIVTNATTIIAASGTGQMTISNATVLSQNVIVGNIYLGGAVPGPRGTLTVVGGTNILSGALTVGNTVNATGSVFVTGGQLIVTNSNQFMYLGFSGVGDATVAGGEVSVFAVVLGRLAGSQGTLTITGGTNAFGGLTVAYAVNSTGTVWITGSTAQMAVITPVIGEAGAGQLTLSNGTVTTRGLTLGGATGSAGSFTMTGGSLLATNTPATETIVGSNGVGEVTISGGTAFFQQLTVSAVGRGTFTSASATNTVSGTLTIASGFNATGAVWVTSGLLVATNSATEIGKFGVGQMTVSNGLVLSRDVNVGGTGRGTLLMAGGTNVLSSGLNISASNAVWVTGGQLVVTNTAATSISGNGAQMTVSNGTFLAFGVSVAANVGVRNTFTIAGGTNVFSSVFTIGSGVGATGTVWVTGGLLVVTNSITKLGVGNGVGQMTISNGTVRTHILEIAINPGTPAGTLTIAGGTTTVASSLTLGNPACQSTGTVIIAGGELDVTNVLGNATLDIVSGSVTLNSGTLVIDRLVITSACGRFFWNGGTLAIGTNILTSAFDADADGIPNGYEESHGLNPLMAADAALDNDGDGQSNLAEFLSGTNPTNSASFFGITGITRISTNILVTWQTGSGKTNALERTAGVAGSFSNDFTAIFTATNTVGTTTNYLDLGAVTNSPAFYYRIRLVP